MKTLSWREFLDSREHLESVELVLDGQAEREELAGLRDADKALVCAVRIESDDERLLDAALHGVARLDALCFGSCTPSAHEKVLEKYERVEVQRVAFRGPVFSSLMTDEWGSFSCKKIFMKAREVVFDTDALRDAHVNCWGFDYWLEGCERLVLRSRYLTDLSGMVSGYRSGVPGRVIDADVESPLITPQHWDYLASHDDIFTAASCARFLAKSEREVGLPERFGELRALLEEPGEEDDATIMEMLRGLHEMDAQLYKELVLPYVLEKRPKIRLRFDYFEGRFLQVQEMEQDLHIVPHLTYALQSGDPAGFNDPQWRWLLASPAFEAVRSIDFYAVPLRLHEAKLLASDPRTARLESLQLGGEVEPGVIEVLEQSPVCERGLLDVEHLDDWDDEDEWFQGQVRRARIRSCRGLPVDARRVSCCMLSPDGTRAATLSYDGNLYIENLGRGEVLLRTSLDGLASYFEFCFDERGNLWVPAPLKGAAREGTIRLTGYDPDGVLLESREIVVPEGEFQRATVRDGEIYLELGAEVNDELVTRLARLSSRGLWDDFLELRECEGLASRHWLEGGDLIVRTYEGGLLRCRPDSRSILWKKTGCDAIAIFEEQGKFIAVVDDKIGAYDLDTGELVEEAALGEYTPSYYSLSACGADALCVLTSYNIELWSLSPLEKRETLIWHISQTTNEIVSNTSSHKLLIYGTGFIEYIDLELP